MGTWEESEASIQEQIKELKDANVKLAGQVASGEALIQRHKQEIGDARKDIKDAISAAKILGDAEKVAKLEKLLDVDPVKWNDMVNKQSEGSQPEKELETLKASLTEEQQKKIDSAYQTLLSSKDAKQVEIARKIAADKAEELAFLKALSEGVPEVRKSLFGGKKQEAEKVDYKKLFGLADGEASFVPVTRKGAVSGFAGAKTADDEKRGDRRLPGGIIPRPKMSEEKQ